MEIKTHKYHDILGVDNIVLKMYVSIILNSDRQALNSYLECRGGMPNIITEYDWFKMVDFANKIHKQI